MTSKIIDISTPQSDGFKFIFDNIGLDISCGTSVLIEGQAGVGKTLLALQMACAYLARAKQDHREEYAWYISFEQDSRSLAKVLDTFSALMTGVAYCDCKEHHSIQPFETEKLHLYTRPPTQELGVFLDKIIQETSSHKQCGLVIVDSVGHYEKDPSRKDLDRLCQQGRDRDFGVVMIREKEPSAANLVPEYVTDTVLELQFKPMLYWERLAYGPQVRTIEIKKSRVQKFHRGPHEFRIDGKRGIEIFPSIDSLYLEKPAIPSSEYLHLLNGAGQALDEQLIRADGKAGLRLGECLLVHGPSGNLKTVLGFHFLKPTLELGEPSLFISFKIDREALKGAAKAYLTPEELSTWDLLNTFIDARQVFWTPARVLTEIRNGVRAGEEKGNRITRAVVFGLGMIDKLPVFRGQELTFLQVLISFFEASGICAMFIDWPQKELQHSELSFDTILNFFSTTIEVESQSRDLMPGRFVSVKVTRHEFRVLPEPTALYMSEDKSGQPWKLLIEKADVHKRRTEKTLTSRSGVERRQAP